MNIAIVGGRDFDDYELLKNTMNNYINNKSFLTAIISGGAKGADSLAEQYAKEINCEIIVYLPDYKQYGRGATIVRNIQIIEHANIVFAFWDGKSRGTLDSINKAKKLNKTLFIINY